MKLKFALAGLVTLGGIAILTGTGALLACIKASRTAVRFQFWTSFHPLAASLWFPTGQRTCRSTARPLRKFAGASRTISDVLVALAIAVGGRHD
jgi:hypothetical protein